MKTINKYFAILIFTVALFATSAGYSQNLLQGDPDPEIEKRAAETTDMWSKELGLTGEQELLMEKKIVEFAMKRKEVLESKMNEAAKKERLIVLQEEENADMADILTQPQMDRYLIILNERFQKAAQNNGQKKERPF